MKQASRFSTAAKWSGLFLVALLSWGLQSCGGNQTSEKATDAVENAKEVNEASAAVDNESSEFAVKAASGGLLEVKLGELAQKNAASPRVKDFGAMMIRDHSKANEELKTLAGAKSIILPDSVSDEHRKHIEELSKKKGIDFDNAYIGMMVSDHKDDVNEFDKAATGLKDPDLKAFAAKTLPILQSHLDAAQDIQESSRKMMNNSNKPGAIGK